MLLNTNDCTSLTATFITDCPPVGAIPTPAIDVTSSEEFDAVSIILPSVLLWNPLHVFKSSFPSGCMSCPDCGKTAIVHYWNDGSAPNKMPRTIYGLHSQVLLVSAVIVCGNGHRTLSHDERVLRLIPAHTQIPFILLHKTGLTLECAETILTLCGQGINFYSIETILYNQYWDKHLKHALMYYNIIRLLTHILSLSLIFIPQAMTSYANISLLTFPTVKMCISRILAPYQLQIA